VSIAWEDPPAGTARSGVTDWRRVADELRQRPGQWAVVATRPSSGAAATIAGAIRKGSRAGMPSGAFEARARTVDGECRVYARYVGESS